MDSIGQAIEARLKPFGAKFLRVARSPREGVGAVSQLDETPGGSRHCGSDHAA